ncbi:MAG: DUF3843 family protein [Lewinellaceae bacterium]|nr:DUF3843 family protein [Lewinellaceae bacterium]
MRKRSLSTQALKTTDWMRYRPYTRFDLYDGYYLKQANAVFEYLNRPELGFRQPFQREHLKILAILITCYFEDFVNDIGLWRALTRKYTELHGYALPFYELSEYDPEYLNPEDFAYLIWHQLSKISHKSILPFSPAILEMADFCYAFFDERLEDAPATPFYDDWLHIGPDIDFFELKSRLKWLAFENYLAGPEFVQELLASLEEIAENSRFLLEEMDPGKLIYSLEDEYLYTRRSAFGAMTMPEWLAEIARCPDELRSDIKRLNRRVYGIFLYEGYDDRHYHFRYSPTKRLFHIDRRSIDMEPESMEPGAESGFFGIVNWRGDWWLSGTYTGWSANPEDERDMPGGVSFYGWSEAEQQRIRESTAEMEESFLDYFGDRMMLFPNQTELFKALEDQQHAYNVQIAKKYGKKEPRKSKTDPAKTIPEDLGLGSGFKDLAIFFVPGEGQLISPVIPELIRWLQADTPAPNKTNELFYSFFTECHPALARFLVERYSGKNLRFPFVDDPAFVERYFGFFMRYFNPGDFREPIPQLSLINQVQ